MSGSDEAAPSRLTRGPDATVRSWPALAVGACFADEIVVLAKAGPSVKVGVPGSSPATLPGVQWNPTLMKPPASWATMMSPPPEAPVTASSRCSWKFDRAARARDPGLVGERDVGRWSVADSSPEPGTPSGSLMTVLSVVSTLFVNCEPSTVFEASTTAWNAAGTLFVPTARSPR